MWKPWILIALGTVLIANVTARGNASADSTPAFNKNHEHSNSHFSHLNCTKEIEKACGKKIP
jgi:hypothetical protein